MTRTAATAVAAALALLCATTAAGAHPRRAHRAQSPPTIVLVHGAFADASGWNAVVSRLQRDGYPVLAPADPLRGVASDAAYLKSVLATISGPIVLAGHSYGGEVITGAATDVPNVRALVYIAAFAPDSGESQLDIAQRFSGALLGPATETLRPYARADGTSDFDQYVKTADFRDVFAADVPAPLAATMAATQRPLALAATLEKAGAPAWKTLPSWYLVAKDDHAISPAAERFMADRAHAHTIEVRSSHAAMVSHPAVTTRLIEAAAQATR